jgi:hypothetical protein
LKGAGHGQRRYWLHIEPDEIDLCLKHPGFDVDLVVRAELRELTEVWLGDRSFTSCLRDESIELDGPARLRKAFPSWLLLSGFAEVERPV